MKKRLFAALAVVLAVAILLPAINLIAGLPQGVVLGSPVGASPDYLAATKILGQKCANCHSVQGNIPFYASLPLVSGLVKGDIKKGTEWFDMVSAFAGAPGTPVNEATLAKIEKAIADGSMPPHRYLAMHWDGGLSAGEKATVLGWVRSVRAASYASPASPEAFKGAVIRPVPPPPKLDPAKVALGKQLYHDKRLSKDNTVSCASCHNLATGGVDLAPVSTGVGGSKGGINAPTVFNAALHIAQFWDGRAADLAGQAAGPPANPIEMASSWPEIVAKLSSDPAFKAEFEASYPGGVTQENICDAIAIYEKTLLTPNSDFDHFLLGDENALSPQAKRGYALFIGLGCATCHSGVGMGGRSYEKMGRAADYFADRGNPTAADTGRAGVTKDPADEKKFKVPTLRNIALTPPYFHDASAKTLSEAVATMAKYQEGKALSDAQVRDLVAFLRSLTGELDGKKLQ